jgi:cytochrome P450
VTLGGYDLPAGAQFLIPQWVPHRDERFWDAPETFDPGRWERDADRPRYAYFPFSGGPRNCIGTRFARLELVLALSTLVGHLEPAVAVDGELSFTPSLQLRPTTDMTATVCRRDTTASA